MAFVKHEVKPYLVKLSPCESVNISLLMEGWLEVQNHHSGDSIKAHCLGNKRQIYQAISAQICGYWMENDNRQTWSLPMKFTV